MLCKLIKVHVKPGHLEAYLAAQEVWNRETLRAPGAVACFCGQDPGTPDVVWVQVFWRSRADLDHWMATEHDRIAGAARADEHYERIEVSLFERCLPGPDLPETLSFDDASDAGAVQGISEIFRASAALRIGVRLNLFGRLGTTACTTDELARAMEVDAFALEKLLLALQSLDLVRLTDGLWHNTPRAQRCLIPGASADQTHMVLHNTQPEYLARAWGFAGRLGLPPDEPDPDGYHEGFLRAMSDTARAGQARLLVETLDLSDARMLLDVGGATGDNTIALCRANPRLHAMILDQPATVAPAESAVRDAGLEARIRVRALDYRRDPFPDGADVILFSNVLRGETPAMIDDMLGRAHAAIPHGGRVIVADLFREDPPAPPGLRAALFGLHVYDGANFSVGLMESALTNAGFDVEEVRRLPRAVVSNFVIRARRT